MQWESTLSPVSLQISHSFSFLVSLACCCLRKREVMFQTQEQARLLQKSGRSSKGKPWAMETAMSLGCCPWGWREGAEEGKSGAERQNRGERGNESDRVGTLKPHNGSKCQLKHGTGNVVFGWYMIQRCGKPYCSHSIFNFMNRHFLIPIVLISHFYVTSVVPNGAATKDCFYYRYVCWLSSQVIS